MKEQDIIDLGFTRQDEYGTEVSDDTGAVWREDDYHYYVYDFALGFSLISSEFDHVTDRYYVDVFNTEPTIRFDDPKELKRFIKLIEKNTIKEL